MAEMDWPETLVLNNVFWLIYSCKPTSSEQKVIDLGVAKISAKNPDAQGDLPFILQPELDDVEDIEEDLPDLPALDPPLAPGMGGSVASQTSFKSAKLAFTSAASPAVDELEEPMGYANSQTDQAKQAFLQTENCPSSTAPPTVMRREEGEEDSKQVPASLPENTKKADVKGPLSVRLRVNKRPKSLASPSPQKGAKVKKCGAKGKADLQVVKKRTWW
ncbi:uncharacterized protein MELLADRAFT_66879 [Melampsora larici-populina 98AG31]|uniref:Uncharacterized protein n=1 Tax=Melampsora larici-populina (strain 98AG31 / pathotype 3-4-7) TaxID=747676 RepID=F4S0Y8_MELLP|nr:uncharacterized protein MELLADRAFT_66879 [Melampsora larici-populina 98AG31]EGG01673.1 hypothetical protein MELLADRAFT_66879 [Melampsora larici-populina 98AG31]